MNHNTSFACGIMLAMAVVLAGCTTAKADPCPTVETSVCPTAAACPEPQACPSAAAQVMPEMSGWRWAVTGTANAIITFGPGDKCSMQMVSKVIRGLALDVVANDNAYQNYVVWIETLDAGKTLEDLKKITNALKPPSWVHIQGGVLATPMSRAFYADVETIDAGEGPIYFTCQVEGPVARKIIDHLGPLEFYTTP
jgi:hypothetical protein